MNNSMSLRGAFFATKQSPVARGLLRRRSAPPRNDMYGCEA